MICCFQSMFDGVSYPVPCLPQVRLESEREAPPRKNGVCRRRSGSRWEKPLGNEKKSVYLWYIWYIWYLWYLRYNMVHMVYMVNGWLMDG